MHIIDIMISPSGVGVAQIMKVWSIDRLHQYIKCQLLQASACLTPAIHGTGLVHWKIQTTSRGHTEQSREA
jgi:hypothetical protein